MMRNRLLVSLLGLTLVAATAGVAAAQQYAPPTISVVDEGLYRITLAVTAGADGSPSGFQIQWMRRADYIALGETWPDPGHAALKYCDCYGPYTLNRWAGSPIMGPNETSYLQLGDLADESGLYGNDYEQLQKGTQYVVRGFTSGDGYADQSLPSSTVFTETMASECTQGFWKTHGPDPCTTGNNSNTWPASCFPMELGDKSSVGSYDYDELEICDILQAAVNGNGLISLAHQLITTKLNGCSTSDLTPIATELAQAQALIGSLVVPPVGTDSLDPSQTSDLTEALDDYNNGLLGGVADCPTPAARTTWGRIKSIYR